ncbi:MAG: glycosyltransferase family 4 protein [Thiohalocapsa sp.]|nr:glycosyltransferase family 4 protein [Thiohalocapsa sp.]MCF7990811.1 glycosyltransferase family 4 protein [Thiohalocapsa sp.]
MQASTWAWIAVAAGPVVGLVASAWLTDALARHAVPALRILDHPNPRSLHETPVPRSGGIAVVAGLLIGVLSSLGALALASELTWIAAAVLLVGAVSLLDDRGDVPQLLRLAAHAGAALLLLAGGLQWQVIGLPGLETPLSAWLALPLTVIYIVWMINLYNFMDGMDGLAGGMALFGFGALALLGLQGEAMLYTAVAATVAAAAAGFLTRNFPPARIFLGDTGSSVLGLLAAAMTLWGAGLGLFPLWVGLLIFSPFVVDATWTLLRRIAAGEPFWLPHRSHHYQRLVLAGWGHRRTVLRAYLLMAGVAASAIGAVAMTEREQWMLLGAWAAVYLLIHFRVGLAERAAGEPVR